VLSPPTFAFCGHCGQPLDGAEPLPLTRAADVSTPREEQRVVRGQLVVVGEDGEDGASFDLFEGINVMGREADCLAFPDDDFMSTPHAEFHVDDGGLEVRPADTTNGVFYRLDKSHALSTGDEIRLGQELLRMHLFSEEMGRNGGGVQADVEGTVSLGSVLPEAVWGKLEQVLGPGAHGSVFLLAGDEVNIGREQGDVVFPKDGYVSGTHARIVRCDDHASIEDLGSSNGTYVRLSDTRRLEDGDHILAGQQLLRVDL